MNKDDYGLVAITTGEPVKIEPYHTELVDSLVVWLLSDVLIRDRQLRPSIALTDLQHNLERALNRDSSETAIAISKAPSGHPLAYMRQRRTESWQQSWGLPRPSLVGLMAGSCIKFDLQTDLTPEQLNQKLGHLAIVGIGERTAEGYGQISFNDPLLDRPISQLAPAISIDNHRNNIASKITSKQKSFAYARIIEKQAWRNEISNSAKALASNPTNRERLLGIKISPNNESCPSMSQLGNLRIAIALLQEPQDIQPIVRWLRSTAEKRSQKWGKTNNGLEKIEELITTQHKVWDELARYTDIPLEDLTLTEDAETFLSDSQWLQLKQPTTAESSNSNHSSLTLTLWSEAIRTVVYECIRAHKREIE